MKSTSASLPPSDRPLETLEEATAYLDGLINRERDLDYTYVRLDLAPIRALLDGIGRPHERLSVIHVAGSKGKGSTCLFAEAILRELGENVGTFTSPHLESWRERFRIDGEPVDEARLVSAVERVRPIVEQLRAGPKETRPSFFDATTAVAFLLFAEAGVDRALIEVGLGGRLDSTNVVLPAVTCITSIELEHVDKLGATEALIAGEKAGILKQGVPVVVGRLRPEAAAVVAERAGSLDVSISQLGVDFDLVRSKEASASSDDVEDSADVAVGVLGERLTFQAQGDDRFETRLAVPGEAARGNAALAVECVRLLGVHESEKIDRAAARALSICRLPGRTEILAADPRVIVDAAHTAESARSLADALESLAPDGFDLLLSVSGDKNLEVLLEALLPSAQRVTATRAEPIRSLPAAELGRRVEAYARSASLEIEVAVEEDPEVAARSARARLEAGKRLCATGSVYLAGVARRVLGADARGEEPPAGGEPGTHLVELEYAIAPACEADLRAIPDLERRAATLFSYEDLPPEIAEEVHSLDELRAAQREGRLLVARSQTSDPLRASEAAPLGFALLRMLDGHAHLEEIDVDPEYARRGIGQRLVASACAWAFDAGAPAITLSTFRDVAWNAPFYARLGFETVPEAEYGDAVRALRESERAQGLPVERRVIMRRPIGPEDRVSAAPCRTRAAPR